MQLDLGAGLFGPVRRSGTPATAGALSIAVLPFAVLGHADELLADALTEDLITDLSRIAGVLVIGRSTMFTYRRTTSDARTVGRELGARYVVTGSLRDDGNRISTNVELVDSANGVLQWADRFEHAAGNWMLAAASISGRIARSLNLGLMEAGSRWPAHLLPAETRALSLAMRGWVDLFSKPQTPATNRTAEQSLLQASELDPGLALAWTGLAYATYRAASFGWGTGSLEEGCRAAVALARKAIALDHRTADAHYAMGQALNALDELERAQVAHETCIALNPSHAPAYAGLGQVRMFVGHPEETGDHCLRAFALSPREPLRAVWHRTKGLADLMLGDPASALHEAEAAIALNPDYPSAYVLLAAAAMPLGDTVRAGQAVERLRAVPRFSTVEAVRRYHARPRRARFSALLERMLEDLRAAGMRAK